jgi:hypothetical protein
MIEIKIDNISFKLRSASDFTFLSDYGKVFAVFDQNDSGNISFGTDNGKEKFFIKVSGAETLHTCVPPEEAVRALKNSVSIYKDLKHPNLIEPVGTISIGNLFATVFKWAEGDCLFDYWNFDKYADNPDLKPFNRFKALPLEKKLKAFDVIFSFMENTARNGYTAVDFYDGSIMYDFAADNLTICDIDFFRKGSLKNDMGEDFWGTKRLKAPEEYLLNAYIDEITNVFTLGALAFHIFGEYSQTDIGEMYDKNRFIPCAPKNWTAGRELLKTAVKATEPKRENRYKSIEEFAGVWRKGITHDL